MKTKRTLHSAGPIYVDLFKKHRRMPTYSEITELLGVRAKSVVHFRMKKLTTIP